MMNSKLRLVPHVDILRDFRFSLDRNYEINLKKYEDAGFHCETVFWELFDNNIYGWRLHAEDGRDKYNVSC